MPGWEQLGMQAASQGISGALGLVLGGINDRRQLRQQEKLQGLQIRGNKELTDYNFIKQMEMWKNTNYPAQMAMLKAAGLNPALMYEGGGQGGSTAITQGSVTGGNAPTGGGEIMQMMAMGLTRDLQLAQIENIKAQTAKTQAETGAVAPQIEKTHAEIAHINQDVQNKIAQQKLTELQQGIAGLQIEFDHGTLENRKSLVNLQLSKINEEISILETQKKLDKATASTKEAILKAELGLKYIDGWLKWAQTNNINQDTINSVQHVKIAWSNDMRQWHESGWKGRESQINVEEAMQNNAFPEELKGLLPGFLIPLGKGGKQ